MVDLNTCDAEEKIDFFYFFLDYASVTRMFRIAKYSTMLNYFKWQKRALFLLFSNWLVKETSE